MAHIARKFQLHTIALCWSAMTLYIGRKFYDPASLSDNSLLVCLKPPGILSQEGPIENLPALLTSQLGGAIIRSTVWTRVLAV